MISGGNFSVVMLSVAGFMSQGFVCRPIVVVVSVDMMVCDVVREILLCERLMTEETLRLILLQKMQAKILQLPSTLVRERPTGTVGLDSIHSPRILHNLLAVQFSRRLGYRFSLAMILVESDCTLLLLRHEFSRMK
jgi:hypothetical protein